MRQVVDLLGMDANEVGLGSLRQWHIAEHLVPRPLVRTRHEVISAERAPVEEQSSRQTIIPMLLKVFVETIDVDTEFFDKTHRDGR